jgi:hypothetical protein
MPYTNIPFQPDASDLERLQKNLPRAPKAILPEGKFNEADEGEIMCRIGEKKGKVFLSFGAKPIAWIAFSKDQALQIAESLTKFANKLN